MRSRLGHVAMVAKFWMTTNRWRHLKVYNHYFKLHRSYSISLNLENLGEVFFGTVSMYLSLEKESDNFCVVFTYSIKRVREIRKFHVVVVQRRKRNVQNSVMHVQSCCLLIWTYYFLPFFLPSPSSLVLCYHGNVTSHFPLYYVPKKLIYYDVVPWLHLPFRGNSLKCNLNPRFPFLTFCEWKLMTV